MLQLLFVDIEKYPVTNEEYWEFCEATNRDKGRTAQGRPRQPVVYVSWFDAMDYACWRATRDGIPWRLPTEDELSAAERLVPEDSDFSQWPLPELPDVDAHPEIVNDLGHECLLGVIYQWTMRPEDKAKYDTLWAKYVKRRNKRETNAAITAAGLTFDAENQVNSGGAYYEAAYLAKESSPCDMTPEHQALDLGFRVAVDAEESNRVFLGSCFLDYDRMAGLSQRSGNRTSLRDDFLGFRLAMDIDNGDDQVVLSGCWAYSEEDAAKGDSSSLEPVFRLNDTGFRLAADVEADRVERGGSWLCPADSARAAYRYRNYPGNRSHYLGFRLVLDTDDWSRAASGGSYYYPPGIASASDGGDFHPGFLRENIGFRLASDTNAAQPRRGGSWFDDPEYAPIIIAGEGDPTNQMRLLGFRLAVDTGDSLRVDRGGYWLEEAFDAGIGKRFEDDPAYAGIVIGFRLAVDTEADRFIRGGSWSFSSLNARGLRSDPTNRFYNLGFRLAADREPERSYRGGRWFNGPDRSKFVTHTGCDTDYSGVGVGFRLAVDTEGKRVFGGGGWHYSAQLAREALRHGVVPTNRGSNLGFRLATDTEADRVGRGGGWYDSARFARTALSLRDDPTICDSRLGFRLAVDTNNNEQE